MLLSVLILDPRRWKIGQTRKLKSTNSAVSNFGFEDNKPFMSVSTPAFVELCEMVSRYTLVTKSIFKPPSRDKIKGTLMRKATGKIEVELRCLEVVAHKYGQHCYPMGGKTAKDSLL